MARRPIITREVSNSVATVLAVNATTHAVSTVEITLPTVYDDNAKALTYINKNYATTDGTIYAAVTELKTVSTLLGMWLEDFIKASFPLDPDTRKPLDGTDDTDDTDDK